ncbi:MAG: metallophosphoesterase family protein [Proteobacteria bacterium]|nr:metallophosphoesterase family protein [Pseudomonadota bacterium]
MTTKLGLISDVHSSPVPLQQALDIFDKEQVSDIICAGDIAGYYETLDPTIDLLIQKDCKTIVGNHDHTYLEAYPELHNTKESRFLRELPQTLELVIEDKKDISGIPDNATAGALHAAKEKGYEEKWLFTLDIPSYLPFIQYADNRELREKIWRAFSSRAWNDEFDNSNTILEIVKLRHERAQLLGYDTHADFVLEHRMAETPKQVWGFLKKLEKIYKPAAQQDLERLQKFAKENGYNDELKDIYLREVIDRNKEYE